MAMPIRTLIVDDEPLARGKLRTLLANEPDIELVGEAGDGDAAVSEINKHKPDLVFLDVQMPERDGFGVLENLDADHLPSIVFVTAHDQFALKAFEVHAIDYLLKPFDRSRFQKALQHAREVIKNRQSNRPDSQLLGLMAELARERKTSADRIAVKTTGRIVLLKVADIDWIEAADNYVKLHTGKNEHLHRETLTSLESRLDSKQFVRISRSAIVNVNRIREMRPLFHGEYSVILHDNTRLTLSRSQRSKIGLLLDRDA